MVRNNPISEKVLVKTSPEERDNLLKKLGFEQSELDNIRNIKDDEERIKEAAKALFGVTNNCNSLTELNIVAVASKEWCGNETRKVYGNILGDIYRAEQSEAKSRGNTSYIHFLREDLGFYKGNLTNAMQVWDKFSFSQFDLLKNVKLPLNIDYEVSQLLGVYWADGNLDVMNRDIDEEVKPLTYKYAIRLSGNNGNYELYNNWLANKIKNIHNIPAPVYDVQRKNRISHPEIHIISKAIITWLRDDLGFPKEDTCRKNVKLPKFDKYSNKLGFLEGIIAGMGSIKDSIYHIYLSDKDNEFLKNIKDLAASLGFNFSEISKSNNCNSYRMHVIRDDIKKLNLINPKHKEILKGA